jgi:hypothetical protein
MREIVNGNFLHKCCAYQAQFTAAVLLCLYVVITIGYFCTVSVRRKHTLLRSRCCHMLLKLHVLVLILLSNIYYQIYRVLCRSL